MRSATLFVIALALASIDCGQCTAECTNLATGTGTLTGDVSTATDTTVCSNGVCSTVPTTFELEGDSSFDVVATYTGDVTGTLRITQQGFITLSVTGKSNGFHVQPPRCDSPNRSDPNDRGRSQGFLARSRRFVR
jgi:hypothetical protein